MSAVCKFWQLVKDTMLAPSSRFLVPAMYVMLHYFHQLLKNPGPVSSRVFFSTKTWKFTNTKEILSTFWSLFPDSVLSPKFLERLFLI